jgi:hypothetical protein
MLLCLLHITRTRMGMACPCDGQPSVHLSGNHRKHIKILTIWTMVTTSGTVTKCLALRNVHKLEYECRTSAYKEWFWKLCALRYGFRLSNSCQSKNFWMFISSSLLFIFLFIYDLFIESVTQNIQRRMVGWIMNCKTCWRKPNEKYHLGICLEGWEKLQISVRRAGPQTEIWTWAL